MYEENDNDQTMNESNNAVQLVGSSIHPHWGEDMDNDESLPGRPPSSLQFASFSLTVH